MTSTLLLLGASLLDTGNISYASNGRVLGEQIVEELGGNPDDSQLIPVQSFDAASARSVHNYAHGGARSDWGPSVEINDALISIGLRQQVAAVQNRTQDYQQRNDVDVVVSAGANDILEQFDDLTTFDDVLTSPGRRDNRQLVRRLSRRIARHLIKSTDALTGFLDEVMLIGTLPISATPLARERSEQLAKAEPSDFLELLDQIGAAQTKRLERVYRRNDQVAVIDAAILWDQIDSPGFIDEVHPDSATSGQLAALIVEQSLNGLDSIGWP